MTLSDAYGRAMLDRLESAGEGEEIVERDDGYLHVGAGPSFYLAPFRDWGAHDKRAMRFVRGRVLDIGCGAGRVALHLQERSFEVLAIDTSPLAIQVCRLRGVRRAEVRSIARLDGLGVFDTIVLLGGNFGLLGSKARARRLLRDMHDVTGDRGRVIAATRDPCATEDADDLKYMQGNLARHRMAGQWRIRVRYRNYCTPWFDHLTVSRPEMEQVIAGTGWHVHRFLDGPRSRYSAVLEKD